MDNSRKTRVEEPLETAWASVLAQVLELELEIEKLEARLAGSLTLNFFLVVALLTVLLGRF